MSTGNCELVGIRCRKTQTLYLSDLIVPSRYENYGKLQFGIFLAAIKDSMERFKIDASNDDENETNDEARGASDRAHSSFHSENGLVTHPSDVSCHQVMLCRWLKGPMFSD